jgi:23S rRNA (adenine2030-N6)-methyltransferase
MKYRHSYHAGNFGDVLKHIALVELLGRLAAKDKPFFFLDTHAGRGEYRLDDVTRREAAHGVLKVAKSNPQSEAIQTWLELVRRCNRPRAGNDLQTYPGSPRLAQMLLRKNDRAHFVELQARDAEALSIVFGDDKQIQVEHGDGYHAIKALLPPHERRGLVLIDPAYERQEKEFDEALAAIKTGLERWPTGIYCLWYPIKERSTVARLKRPFEEGGWPPTLAAELCVYRDDSRVGLNGAGVLILNPPWQLDVSMRGWIKELHDLLAYDRAAPWSVEWLVPDK